jgi:hypothetical protein
MTITKVSTNPHGFTCSCIRCGKTIGAMGREHEPRYADHDGIPFRSYYCEPCAIYRNEQRKAEGFDNTPIVAIEARGAK